MDTQGSPTRRWPVRRIVAVILIAIAILIYVRYGQWLTLDFWAAREQSLRVLYSERPWQILAGAGGLYVLATGLSLPGAAALTLVYAWFFGFFTSLILISFASTAGATLAFLLTRFLLRDWVRSRFPEQWQSFQRAWDREGVWYLFTLRLIPAVPFFLINLLMGLTPISARTFWWVSQLGMIPGTAAYVYAGSRVPSLQALAKDGVSAVFTPSQTLQLVLALTLLGLFPWAVRFLMARLGGVSANPVEGDKP